MAEQSNSRRAPPAYQEYAASLLADRSFRSMSAVERGVHHSMRLECWVNQSIPADKTDLARVLGLSESEVQQGLTMRVLARFERQMPDGKVLVCTELEEYRAKLDANYQNRAAAGLKNINAINERRKAKTSNPTSDPSSNSTSPKYSTNKTNQVQPRSLNDGNIPYNTENADFIRDFDSTESADDAAARYRAARGG